MRAVLAPLALALLLTSPALAQKKAKTPVRPKAKAAAASVPAPPAKVTLGLVRDRRTDGSFFKKLEINLELPDVPAADVAAARTVVRSAVDDTGRNLVPDDSGKGGLQDTRQGSPGEPVAKAEPTKVTVELRNPSRKAIVVKSVTGEIELYMPRKDPNGVATVTGFMTRAGVPLQDPALKANGLEITVVSKAQLEAEKQRRIGNLKRDLKAKGVAADTTNEMVADFASEFLKPEEGNIVLKVRGPEGLIHQICYLNPAGEEKFVSTSEKQGFTVLSTWGEKPAPDWRLRLKMKTPRTLARFSFALKDVALP